MRTSNSITASSTKAPASTSQCYLSIGDALFSAASIDAAVGIALWQSAEAPALWHRLVPLCQRALATVDAGTTATHKWRISSNENIVVLMRRQHRTATTECNQIMRNECTLSLTHTHIRVGDRAYVAPITQTLPKIWSVQSVPLWSRKFEQQFESQTRTSRTAPSASLIN